jgi:hypothetical protein
MQYTHYHWWLVISECKDVHAINTKLEYLHRHFDFVKGQHFLAEDSLAALKAIESYYFDTVIAPTLGRESKGAVVLTDSQLLDLYKRGQYSFNVPPVSHAKWNALDWARYINQHGFWHGAKDRI